MLRLHSAVALESDCSELPLQTTSNEVIELESPTDEPLPTLPDRPHSTVQTVQADLAGEENDARLAGTQPIAEVAGTDAVPAYTAPAPGRAYSTEEFDADAEWAANTSVDDVLAFFPAANELNQQFKPRVQEAFTLARNGALHAARARFEQLLYEMAQTKDASQMTSRHVRSLSSGLQALDEADDFITVGSHREDNALSLAAGHRTPMLHEKGSRWTLPHEAIAMYHLYSQQKLAGAVEDEQAGSMMLFGLGKVYAHLAEREGIPQARRKSLTMYRAAVAAHQRNYLAANEAGVLLARAGRYAHAAEMLERAAQLGGVSTTHRNLALVYTKLGDTHLAQQHRQLADQIADREVARGQLSAERGIAWMSPEEFNRRSRGERPNSTPHHSVEIAQKGIPLPPPKLPQTSQQAQEPPPQPSLWW